ncbi:uncharacterized protein LOC131877773 [Tigriopus californicus]|uniref:uncharacterized protein LOC131877773 n=1 Tax=Tigriopus californicus TaxID=6832 RepID=UPI0027DA651E|nr:uncharacterized protein LOC131877773 [Tigriopus californicus]
MFRFVILWIVGIELCMGLTSLKTSQFSLMSKHCNGSWDVKEETSVVSPRLELYSSCVSQSQTCDAILEDKENSSSQMIHFTEKFICYPEFSKNANGIHLQMGTHNLREVKKRFYLGLPTTNLAHSMDSLANSSPVETLTIPWMPRYEQGGTFGPATKYKNGFVSCLGWTVNCYYWHIGTDFWDSFPSLLEPHGHGGLVVVDIGLMVIGGTSGSAQYTDSVEVFSEYLQKWEPGVNLPQKMSRHATQAFDEKTVIVSGGWDDVTSISKVYKFVTGESQWTIVQDLPFSIIHQFSVVATLPDLGRGILAVAGTTNPSPNHQPHYQAYFWNTTTGTFIDADNYDLPTDCDVFEGSMFQFGQTLIISAFYESTNRTTAPLSSKIVTKDLANPNSLWITHDAVVEKGPQTQLAFEIDEYIFN